MLNEELSKITSNIQVNKNCIYLLNTHHLTAAGMYYTVNNKMLEKNLLISASFNSAL